MKGRGLSGIGLEDTPELLRVKKANQILNQVKHTHTHTHTYKNYKLLNFDLEFRCVLLIVCVCVCVCVCDLQKEYRRDLETEIVGKGMELSADVLEIQRAKSATEIQSQAGNNIFVENKQIQMNM